jgi:4-hydroxybenzoate polyprenyltransferase
MKLKKAIIQTVLLLLFFAITFIINNEIAVTIILILFLIIAFKFRYNKGEWRVFVLGLIIGIVLELGGYYFHRLQYWTVDGFFGIPLWLPVVWGIGFVFIRRIGNLLVDKK